MCAGCAIAAAAGANGVRAWLAAHHLTWLTPGRMRAVTIALFAAALIFSSVSFSGSSKAAHAAGATQPAHATR
jgi:hypothetical protein